MVKELRYVLQMANRNGQPAFVKALGEVKDAIGEWHDREELIAIANDVLDHGAGCGLVRKFKEISEQKYERALNLANQVQRTLIFLLADFLELPHEPAAGAVIQDI